MANYNKVILIGNLTRDPQLKYLPSQTAVVEIGLAVNRRWKSQDGQQREETCFVDCTAFGRQAEIINQYVRKGNPMLVEGHLKLDTWEGKDGQKRSKLRVMIDGFQFLGQASGGSGGGGAPAAAPRPARGPGQAPPPPAPPQEDYGDEFPGYEPSEGGEDIPF